MSTALSALPDPTVPGPRRPSWRRATVMAAATYLLTEQRIEPWHWFALAVVFVVGDAAQRLVEAARRTDV